MAKPKQDHELRVSIRNPLGLSIEVTMQVTRQTLEENPLTRAVLASLDCATPEAEDLANEPNDKPKE